MVMFVVRVGHYVDKPIALGNEVTLRGERRLYDTAAFGAIFAPHLAHEFFRFDRFGLPRRAKLFGIMFCDLEGDGLLQLWTWW